MEVSSTEQTAKGKNNMSILESFRFIKKTNEIGLIEMDLIGEKVNKLSTPVMFRLQELLVEVEKSGGVSSFYKFCGRNWKSFFPRPRKCFYN